MRFDRMSWDSEDRWSCRIVTGGSLILLIVLLLPETHLLHRFTGFERPPSRVEMSTVLEGVPVMRAAKEIDQRLWAAGFQPGGSNPDPASPRIVAVRPIRALKFDSYEAPSLRMEIALKEEPDRTEVHAVVTPGKIVARLSTDTGEGDYYRALLDHVVTGAPLRRIGDAGVGAVFCLVSAWFLALQIIGCQFGWMKLEGSPVHMAGVVSASLFFLALLERYYRRNIVNADLTCAFSLLTVCGAILFRAFTG